jgi:hypothetical protein
MVCVLLSFEVVMQDFILKNYLINNTNSPVYAVGYLSDIE